MGNEMANRGSRTRQRAGVVVTRLAAVILPGLVVAMMLLGSSRAAFSDTTTNGSNSWSAGTVDVTDDDGASVMFNVSGMKPGDTSTKCIAVNYVGSLTADVRLFGAVAGTGLASYLNTTVEIGSGGSFASCAGFTASSTLFSGTLASLGTTHSNFSNAMAGFVGATNGNSRTYRFTVSLTDNNAAQGLNASATFTWEAQNN